MSLQAEMSHVNDVRWLSSAREATKVQEHVSFNSLFSCNELLIESSFALNPPAIVQRQCGFREQRGKLKMK